MSRISIEAKYLGEAIKQTFDFASKLAVGETISTATVTATVHSGTDLNPGAITITAAAISGTKVIQLLLGGTVGVTYLLVCQITTSASQTLSLNGYLAVVPTSV